MKIIKKTLVFLLTVIILIPSFTVLFIHAENVSGTCGEDLEWRIEGDSLIISGNGPMTNYFVDPQNNIFIQAPWKGKADFLHLIIEPGVTTVGNYAFSGMQFKSISLPDTLIHIGDYAFYFTNFYYEITIPDSVLTMGNHVFYESVTLERITLSNSLTEIPDDTFGLCESLYEVNFGNNITTIGNAAFSGTALTKVVLPDSLKTIKDNAFDFNQSLTEITIPASVTHIGKDCFSRSWDLVIKCGAYSYAYEYAKNNNIDTFITDVKAFPDVVLNSWYTDAVKYCTAKEYITGTDKGTFEPESVLTREQFVVILARVSNADLSKYTEIGFKDVKSNSWYASAVSWASYNNYINGIGAWKFGVGQSITREQVATLFYRYSHINPKSVDYSVFNTFKDCSNVSDWAKDGVAWAIKESLLGSTNTSEKIFAPKMKVTRAQAAKIFMSYDGYLTTPK